VNKSIFITGVMGFVGFAWAKKLLQLGNIVYGLDIKKNSTFFRHKNFYFYQDTVFNEKKIEKLIKKSDIVCHFAGIAQPQQYLVRPIDVIKLTVLPSLKIIEFAAKYKKKIFFTSTSEVYGKLAKIPFSENDDRLLGSTEKTRWCYSTSKSLVEHYIKAYSVQNKLKYIIFRLFNIYGPGLEGRVVDIFIKNALNGKNLLINGNGNQKRCYMYIDDCVDAFAKIFLNNKICNTTFNIGSDQELSVMEIAKKIIKLTNSSSKIIINSNQLNKFAGYEDIQRRVPDLKKLKKYIKWEAKIDINEGLKKMISSY
jgi:UDP-glucose 4-epimerase